MKMKYILFIFLLLAGRGVFAQEKHFIFIQSDSGQPFYVSLNGKVFSSSASGYLIIPKLTDGEHKFVVGFAKNEFPEQSFVAMINKKDLGYSLKNFGDKGWGLFNLQTLEVTMGAIPDTSTVAAVVESQPAKSNTEAPISFDKKTVSANTADTAIAMAETKTSDTAIAVDNKSGTTDTQNTAPVAVENSTSAATGADTVAAVVNVESNEHVKDTPAASTGSPIIKLSEVRSDEGVFLSYLDTSNHAGDTIKVIIPAAPAKPATTSHEDTKAALATEVQKTPTATQITGDKDVKFLDIDMSGLHKDLTVAEAKKAEVAVPNTSTGNCKNVATEDDYIKLRKKMAMETSDEKMINEAKKSFRNKCYTTSQIKGLSTLFMSDEGRYNFFDASYVSVADSERYSSLEFELIDPAYKARFKAMVQ